eukprot:TRINITY_DN4682_c0_g1_i3.p1 TRINITY_DN4682_c0_g1~~TRINITY_DN4682_c0_g1_i3.p1  ORF type:complete len:242 (-),score=72.85 TRINITY_DN4682_c0_g1_i3:62-787(-)
MKASATKLFTKPLIIMAGAPGAGKSTIGQLLSKDLNFSLFSSGSYLRSLVRAKVETPLSRLLKESMMRGSLVSSAVVTEVMRSRLVEEADASSSGIIFDGCPRIKVEAEELLKMADVRVVLYLYADVEILKTKIMGRRECTGCHKTFNFAQVSGGNYRFGPILPKTKGKVCDECGSKLIKREDDNEASITERMKEYYTKTYPVIKEVYEKLGVVRKVIMCKGAGEYEYIKTILLKELGDEI